VVIIMADEPDFDETEFYEHAKRAEAHFANDVSRRHHRAALKDFMHWMDRSGASQREGVSPGAKAAHAAATQDAQAKELSGRIKIVDETKVEPREATPVSEQPRDFNSASEKAHEVFMNAVGGKNE
jgi:Tfp pilus assembly protein PilE